MHVRGFSGQGENNFACRHIWQQNIVIQSSGEAIVLFVILIPSVWRRGVFKMNLKMCFAPQCSQTNKTATFETTAAGKELLGMHWGSEFAIKINKSIFQADTGKTSTKAGVLQTHEAAVFFKAFTFYNHKARTHFLTSLFSGRLKWMDTQWRRVDSTRFIAVSEQNLWNQLRATSKICIFNTPLLTYMS